MALINPVDGYRDPVDGTLYLASEVENPAGLEAVKVLHSGKDGSLYVAPDEPTA